MGTKSHKSYIKGMSNLDKTLIITVKDSKRTRISGEPSSLTNIGVLEAMVGKDYPLFRHIREDMKGGTGYSKLCKLFKKHIKVRGNRINLDWDAVGSEIVSHIKGGMAKNEFHLKPNAPSTIAIKNGIYHLGTIPLVATRQLMNAVIWTVE